MKRIGNLSKRRLPQTAAVFGLVLGLVWFVISNPAQPNRDPAPDSLIAHEFASSNSELAVSLSDSSHILSTDRSPQPWKNGRRVDTQSDSRAKPAPATEIPDHYSINRLQGNRSSTEPHTLNDSEGHPIQTHSERAGVEASDSDDAMSDEPDDPLDDLQRNSHISGRVLDQNGMGIAGVGLVATVQQLFVNAGGVQVPAQYLQYQSISDVDGRYRFSQIMDGDYRVSTVSNGQHASAQIRVRSGTEFANIVLSQQRHIVLRGRVSSTTGEPLWSALVSPLVSGVAGAYTDGRGQYQLAAEISESRGGIGIRAKMHGYREQMILLNEADLKNDTVNVDFTLEPITTVAMVSGRVIGARHGRPLTGVAVEMRSPQLKQLYQSVTGDGGDFLFNSVETGDDYQLLVNGGESYQNSVQQPVEVNPGGLNLNIALESSSQSNLYGQVSNLGGRVIPGYTLSLRRTTPPFNTIQVASDSNGQFTLHDLAAGELVFERRAYPQIKISGIELAENVDKHVRLVLDWGSDELTGVIVDAGNNPVGGSTAMLTWSHVADGIQTWSTRTTTADAQGAFRFRELGPGPHTIIVDAAGFNSARLNHDVTADGYDVVVQLDPVSTITGGGH